MMGRSVVSLARIFTLGFLLLMCVGCTRSVTKPTIRVVIPANSSGQGSQATGDKLNFAIVNVRVSGSATPKVYEFNFEANPVLWGTPVDLVIPDVPQAASVLIQFLGVYETAAGNSWLMAYGDVLTPIQAGANVVDLIAAPAGTAGREGSVSGRYFNTTTTGPTGTLVGYYQPPIATRPAMALQKTSVVNGWFNVFALDNIPMTWKVLETGYTMFSALTLGAPEISANGVAYRLQVDTPTYYRKDQRDGGTTSIRRDVEGRHVMGFFKDASVPTSVYTSPQIKQVCYHTSPEGMVGWYGAITLGRPAAPVKYTGLSGSSTDTYVSSVSAGSQVSFDTVMTQSGTCDPSSGDSLLFYPHRLSQDEGGHVGLQPPFRVLDAARLHEGYLRRKFLSGPDRIRLEWRYLAGAAPGAGAIDGAQILMRVNSSGGGGGGGGRDESCQRYFNDGYTLAADLRSSLESFDIQPTGLTASNQGSYDFVVCAYRGPSSQPVYIGRPIRSGCWGQQCETFEHKGWGVTTVNNPTGATLEAALGINASRVIEVDATSSDVYTLVSLQTSSQPIGAGDVGREVMLSVESMSSGTPCGSIDGYPIRPGMRDFVRLLSASASLIKIPKGTFIDGLPQGPSTALAASPISSGSPPPDHCYVRAVTVPHFENLSISSSLPAMQSFSFGGVQGGLASFRVSGVLTVLPGGATIDATGRGYGGGSSVNSDGAGTGGDISSLNANGGSGGRKGAASSGGGGGVWGRGGTGRLSGNPDGQGGSSLFGGGGGGSIWNVLLGMGGGGAGFSGVAGGGSIFAVAHDLDLQGSLTLSADGLANANTSQGGGGAGSVALLASYVNGSAGLNLSAKGGDTLSTTDQGGGGGGGVVNRVLCDTSSYTGSVGVNVAAGTSPFTSDPNRSLPGAVFDPLANGGYAPLCNR